MTRIETEHRVIEAARRIRDSWFRDKALAYGMDNREWELDAALRELDTFALPADAAVMSDDDIKAGGR